MRAAAAGLAVLAAVSVAAAQQPRTDKDPLVRYGVVNSDFYPQGTAKEVLASVAKLLENKRYEYLAAHLLDPAFVDARVAEKARTLTAEVEKGLRASGEAIPADPAAFAQRVQAEVDKRAFQAVVKAIAENLNESPENGPLLAKFARDGAVTEGGGAAAVSLKSVPDRQVFLKQVGTRWYIEDRQQESPKAKEKADK